MKKTKNKKGITLIALIITIVIIIILASTFIVPLINNGIIGKANEAAEKTKEQQLQEAAFLAWSEAYANGKETVEELESSVLECLEQKDVDLSNYAITVTTTGVKVQNRKLNWIVDLKELTVTKDKTTLKIGDTIKYDETNNGAVTVQSNVEWGVLGADDNGRLLLMSKTSVVSEKFSLGSTTDLEKAKTDFVTAIDQLDAICEKYSYGSGAINGSGRSIRVEDINKLTGYNPYNTGVNNIVSSEKGEVCFKGTMKEYGITTRFTKTDSGITAYTPYNNYAGITLSDNHANGFLYYNEGLNKFEIKTEIE